MGGLRIYDQATLNAASAFAHDGAFWISGIEFDHPSRIFRLLFHLPNTEQIRYRRILWPVSRRFVPFARWQLTFRFADECRINVENELNKESMRFEIASLQLNAAGTKVVISTHFVMTIDISISALSGEIDELPGTSEMPPLCSLVVRSTDS